MSDPTVREIVVEVIERRRGLWCPRCRCLTGAVVTLARALPNDTVVVWTVARCAVCRGPVREPSV